MEIVKANITHLNELVPLLDNYRVFYKQVSDLKNAKLFLQKRFKQQDSVIYIAYVDIIAVEIGRAHV